MLKVAFSLWLGQSYCFLTVNETFLVIFQGINWKLAEPMDRRKDFKMNKGHQRTRDKRNMGNKFKGKNLFHKKNKLTKTKKDDLEVQNLKEKCAKVGWKSEP